MTLEQELAVLDRAIAVDRRRLALLEETLERYLLVYRGLRRALRR